jgi:ATP-binding cassette subfamily F protein 3
MVRGRISDPNTSTQRSPRPTSSPRNSSSSAEKPSTRSPSTLRFLIKDLEKEIKRLTKAKDRLEAKVADLAVSGDHVALSESGAELTAVIAELDAAEEQWLELSDEAERASN